MGIRSFAGWPETGCVVKPRCVHFVLNERCQGRPGTLLRLAETVYIYIYVYTVYDCIFGDFPAKNAIYNTVYLRLR